MSSAQNLRHALQYGLFRTAMAALFFPAWRGSPRAFAMLFSAAGLVRLNALGMKNLDLAYRDSLSKEQKKSILKRLYRNLGRMVVELETFRREGPSIVSRLVEPHPTWKHVEEAMSRGNGAVVVTPHFGNWELISSCFALRGHCGAVVGKRMKNPKLDCMIKRIREANGFAVIEQNESPRKILRVLSQNRPVGILPDADTTRLDGIFLDFFGRPTYTPTGPASLAVLSGAPIVPVFLVFENGRYRLEVETPVYPQTGDRSEEEILRLTKHWSDAFERKIREHPDHWMWFQRRWTTTPENYERKKTRRRRIAGKRADR